MATYAGWAALKFKDKIPSVPYLLTLQSGDSDEFIKKRTWFWERRYSEIYTKADKITAISNWLKDRAQKYGYKKDVEIIPNGVDIEKFDIEISKEERDSIRGSWGASESDIVLITTSRLVHKNGIDTLIDNMRLFPQNVKLVIAGEGEEEKKLREQANEFGDRVKFLRNVEHDKIPKLLKSADMFFRLSRSEGMGNSFVEAKAAGLLVVGTDVGGIKDLISQEIVLEYDTSRVSSVIKQIKNNPDIYNKLRDSGKDKVKELFNWNNISNQYNKEYKKLIL
jgi:glycosyltransferase involved in cell wall biosynthesis